MQRAFWGNYFIIGTFSFKGVWGGLGGNMVRSLLGKHVRGGQDLGQANQITLSSFTTGDNTFMMNLD